jgi:hypothetical protein
MLFVISLKRLCWKVGTLLDMGQILRKDFVQRRVTWKRTDVHCQRIFGSQERSFVVVNFNEKEVLKEFDGNS